ncbi:MAG: PDZ domain-containing protein [Clostridia bacterium]|nr:PDZ domain-containing protein [Clostridia bacterium]
MNKKVSLGVCLSLVIIAIAATFAVTMVFSKQMYNGIISNISTRSQSYDAADEISGFISSYYYGSLDDYNNNLGGSVAQGYVNGLNDPYSYYMSASEYADYIYKRDNGVAGIGIETAYDDDTNSFLVAYVYEGSPAYNEGMKSGDVITAVDDVTVTKSNYGKLESKFYGTKLQTVKVEYMRDDVTKTAQLMLGFTIPSVTYKTSDTVAYVRISRFYKNTPSELDTALAIIKNSGIENVIFDVRNTTAGTIKFAAQTIDVIVPNISSGNIAAAVDKSGNKETFTAQNSSYNFRYVVLINSRTSGAAELFACDLRDISQAQLVGTVTAGVGTMQKDFALSDGSAVMLTTALVIPKNGESAVYDKVGVSPTLEVTLLGNDSNILILSESEDNQLTAALSLVTEEQ